MVWIQLLFQTVFIAFNNTHRWYKCRHHENNHQISKRKSVIWGAHIYGQGQSTLRRTPKWAGWHPGRKSNKIVARMSTMDHPHIQKVAHMARQRLETSVHVVESSQESNAQGGSWIPETESAQQGCGNWNKEFLHTKDTWVAQIRQVA